MKKVTIGSRESILAVIQSENVKKYLESNCPDMQVDILTMKTTGDKILNQSLEKIGGKGLFVKELDQALMDKRTDLSVHSLKDVPMELPEELPLIGYSDREDPRDVLVLPAGKTEIDFSKPIGCSSKRRIIQLQRLYPQARFETIRGNVQTRLKKLDEGQFGATILAAAGLIRLGLEDRISRYFTVDEIIPAAGQAILGIQGRKDQDYGYLEGYTSESSQICATAERAFVRGLGGNCSTPVASYATLEDDRLTLRGLYQNEITGCVYEGRLEGTADAPEELGYRLAHQILDEMHQSVGKVWLVGAGPSDPGLFTIKGKQVLAEAEVVVYDALVGNGVLQIIPENAEIIYVGKRSSNHAMPQEQISELLVKKAAEGKRVVRLKGGDPFLFGRGGEEIELLAEHGIPYEVVPGITSAISVPAYQGIPVTHRDFCSSVHIITGHKRAGQTYDMDFDALVRTRGTLVFLMGVAALGDICHGLLEAGMDPEMPAALLMQGTTAAQRRIVATVSTLEEEVQRQGAITPAIIVVGRVCSLAEEFSWVEKLPLGGVKVVLTRPRELVSETAAKLRGLGAEVLEIPAIRTVKRQNNTALYEALHRLDSYDWLVFTSPTGVRIFFEELADQKLDIRHLGAVKIASIGNGTQKELAKHHLYADLIPEIFDGDHLGAALAEAGKPGQRVLIPRAAVGNQELVKAISFMEIDDIPTYDTIYETDSLIDLKKQLDSNTVDYIMFTSASTVKGFVSAAGDQNYSELKAICIGKQTRQAADQMGMQTWMAETATIDSLIQCLIQQVNEKRGA